MNSKLLIIIALLICFAIPTVSGAVVVDEDLIWTEGTNEYQTGGGFEIYEAKRTDVSGMNVSLDLSVLQGVNSDYKGTVDWSLYDTAIFDLWGQHFVVPFNSVLQCVELGPVYAIAPVGTRYNNIDWGYSPSWSDGSIAFSFGLPSFDTAGGISLTLVGNATEIVQHVTVETTPVGYVLTLSRNSVTSKAELFVLDGGVWKPSDTEISSNDWYHQVPAWWYSGWRLDVTIDGETKSVSWGGSPITPTPTPTIPTDINNTTPVDLDKPIDIGYSGPDWDNLRLPPHIPGLDTIKSLKENARNSSTSLFPLYNESYQSFCDSLDSHGDFLIGFVSGFAKSFLAPFTPLPTSW